MRIYACLLSALLIWTGSAEGSGNLVVSPGFEGSPTYTVDWPNEYGQWGGDMAELVSGPHNGVSALEGQQMLRFEASNSGGHGTTGGCQVLQVLDVSAEMPLISSGDALAIASASFNRVAGDAETDAEFAIRLFAYSGSEDQHFALKEASGHLLRHEIKLFSDSDPNTWEQATVSMWLPADTDFLVVELAANEDIFNDLVAPEFDGHYADGVSVTIVPEPATMSLLALGGVALLRRRK